MQTHTTHVCPRHGLVRGPEMAEGRKGKTGSRSGGRPKAGDKIPGPRRSLKGRGSEPRMSREARLILGLWAVFRIKSNSFPKHNGCSGRAAPPQILQDDQKISERSVCLRFTVPLHRSKWFFPVYKMVWISSRGGTELSCYVVLVESAQSAYCCALALVCRYDLSFRCAASGNIVQKFFLLFLAFHSFVRGPGTSHTHSPFHR